MSGLEVEIGGGSEVLNSLRFRSFVVDNDGAVGIGDDSSYSDLEAGSILDFFAESAVRVPLLI